MEITNIKVFPIQNPKGKVLAMASFSLQGKISFNGFTIVKGDKGLFLSSPSRQNPKTKKYSPFVFFNDKKIQDEISKTVIAEYKNMAKNEPKQEPKKEGFLDDEEDITFP